MFFSTRNENLRIPASLAILKGLSDDGGLFLPDEIKKLKIDEKMLSFSYQDLAFEILRLYLDDFTDDEIKQSIKNAYSKSNFNEMILDVHNENNLSFLELFHGSTITFKDMALSILPYLIEISLKKNNVFKKMLILTATSGDTGSAALSNFSKCENIDIKVFYPEGGISKIQEKQMLSFTNSNARAYSLKDSNFDDCQAFVKELLNEEHDNYILSSANSINIGRLLPQIIYYYQSYIKLVNDGILKLNEEMDVIVPTGNFGNILACYLAKLMGCPISKIICASNENSVLTDFFNTGIYSIKREFIKTNSPSMDILISSNLERFLYLLSSSEKVNKYMKDLKDEGVFEVSNDIKEKLKDFEAYSINQTDTLKYIKDCFNKYNYLIDPHTAVAYGAFNKRISNNHTLIVSTASPYKFPLTILESFGESSCDDYQALKKVEEITKVKIPSQLIKLINHDIPPYEISKDEVRKIVYSKNEFDCVVPGTTSNLGCGFDVVGLALNLYNTFNFKISNKDELYGFNELDTFNNLVLSSYRRFFTECNLKYVPISITLIETNVPESRGLGSSATCIIAGLLAANRICNNYLTKEKLLNLATKIEGHPDNVAPALYGGFIASYKVDDEIKTIKYNVSQNLHFMVAIPDQMLSTSLSRSVLPKELKYPDIVYNLSRVIHLPKALEEGNIDLLKDIIKDSLHTPYRLPLITDSNRIIDISNKYRLPVTISGSGSTMLVISDKDTTSLYNKEEYQIPYLFKDLRVDKKGAYIKEYE